MRTIIDIYTELQWLQNNKSSYEQRIHQHSFYKSPQVNKFQLDLSLLCWLQRNESLQIGFSKISSASKYRSILHRSYASRKDARVETVHNGYIEFGKRHLRVLIVNEHRNIKNEINNNTTK